MRCNSILLAVTFAAMPALVWAADEMRGETNAVNARHVKVYYEKGRFGGWPANHGMWNWGNEILVGFSRGYYKDLGPTRHHIDREKPEEHWLARSLDGGETWSLEYPAEKGYLVAQGGALHGTESTGLPVPEMKQCPGGVDFTHPDFAMTLRMTDVDAQTPSKWYYSYDRGHTWEGPFILPNDGVNGIAARTDYIVDGEHECTLFLTAGKSDGTEGRPFCMRTANGGKTWEFLSWIMPEPEGFGIMPSTVRLSKDTLITTIRRRETSNRWIAAYISNNNGRVWEYLNDPVETLGEGNPPCLIRLADGRLCLTYGVRMAPFRIAARLSGDGGLTWSREIVLRDDGNDRDIGYCRSVQRPDGKVVTTYYINDTETGPERYIAATIWEPAKAE